SAEKICRDPPKMGFSNRTSLRQHSIKESKDHPAAPFGRTPMPFVPITQLSPQSVEWLWPGRLARGQLHLVDGDPGKGKGLVLIDPLLAFLDPAVNIGSDPSVRQALAPLLDLATAHRAAIVMQRHLNKSGSSRSLYRGLASIAFMAACRIAWLLGPDPKLP